MEAAAPPRLSGLARLLLQRPPSLREMATLVGYADDYAWFAGLVNRLFPQEAEETLSAPGIRQRLEGFARLFAQRHFPLYTPFLEFFLEDGDDPPWTLLRKGIPYDLVGFGCDSLHEMWGAYRDGISALALLIRPPECCGEPDGLRTAWLESAAGQIPRETLLRIPHGGIPINDLTASVNGTGFEGAAQTASWVMADTGNFFLDNCYEDGWYDGFADPWDYETITEATAEWRRASALMDSVSRLTDWLEEDLPSRFAEMLDFILPRLPNRPKEQEDDHHDQ